MNKEKEMTYGQCKVRNCVQNGSTVYKSAFHLPKFKAKGPMTPNQELRLQRREAWLKALGYEENVSRDLDNLVVCPKHFVFGKPAALSDIDSIDWVPTQHLGQSECSDVKNSDVVVLTLDAEDNGDNMSVIKDGANNPEDNKEVPTPSRVSVEVNVRKRKLPPLKPSPHLVQRLQRDKDIDDTRLSGLNTDRIFKDFQEQSGSTEYNDLEGLNSSYVIRKLKDDNKRLLSQNLSLKAKLLETESLYKSLETDHRISMSKFSDLRYAVDRFTISEKTFVADEEKVKHFTGLPTFDVLKAMFTHIEPYMDTTQFPITKFQQYILTIMGMRLNIGFDLLGHLFRLPLQTVSKIFSRVLQVMHARYKPLVSWPTRANLFSSMPLLFRETFAQQISVIVVTLELSIVIDSIELMMDGPLENGPSPSTVVSEYKHDTIAKFVIGMTPQGAVIFVSKGFTEDLSEKELVETSGLLVNLLAGDLILGGKESFVYEVLEKKPRTSAERNLGSAGGNLLYLHPWDQQSVRNVVKLKTHVEQIAGNFKKSFQYWSPGLPVEFFNVAKNGPPAIDKMIQACCALNNARLTVVT